MFVPVPEATAAGVFEEHANIAYTVEQWVLGRFIDGTDPPYTWVLSGMTFTATVLLGVFAGHVLRCALVANDEIRLAGAARRRLPRAPAGPGPSTCTSRSSSTSGPARWSCGPPAGATCCSPCSIS